jgi:hypothetical protein
MKDKIIVVFSSHLGEEYDDKFTKHISDTIGVSHSVKRYPNFNQFSLTEVYNLAIKENIAKNVIFVFLHNDITIRTPNWGRLLLTKFNNADYSIIGVAGSPYLHETGVWWHDRSTMHGVVEHTDGVDTWVNEYSKPIKGKITPVVVIDGLFMAIDCDNIEHRFDEDFKGYHLYDLSFCLPNFLSNINIGVTTDIRILHNSVGMVNEQWELNRQQFVEKYKEDLPISINDFN